MSSNIGFTITTAKKIKFIDIYKKLDINFESNNQNHRSLGFASFELLQQIGAKNHSWCIIKTLKNLEYEIFHLIFLIGCDVQQFGKKMMDNKSLYISGEIFSTLGLGNQEKIVIQRLQDLPIREYQKNSKFNYFPDLQVAAKIVLVNIRNKNTVLNSQEILKYILDKPFIVRPGDILKIDLSDKKLVQKLDYEQLNLEQINKIYKINQKNSEIQKNLSQKYIFDSGNYIYYQIEAVLHKQFKQTSQKGNENYQLTVVSKNNFRSLKINQQFFLADLKGETDIILENFSVNQVINQKPLIQNEREIEYLKLFKEILKFKNYDSFMKQILKPFIITQQQLQKEQNGNCQMKTILISGSKGIGKKLILKFLANKFGLKYYEKDISKISSVKHLEQARQKGINMRPCLIHFRNLKSMIHIISNKVNQEPEKNFLKQVEQFLQDFKKTQYVIGDNFSTFLVFSIDKFNDVDANDNMLKSYFDYYIQFKKSENESDYHNLLDLAVKSQQDKDFWVSENDYKNTKRMVQGLPYYTIYKQVKNSKNSEKLIKNLENLKKSPDIEALSIPNVTWDDVGGLKTAKQEITQILILPQTFPQLFTETFRPRTGLLFFGPPGTGKTLLAKCIATECNMNFLSIKGPELLNMYIGESEKNVRDIFAKARRNTPCVMFFDELDAIAPVRGNGSDSSQVMDRIVAQFFTEMDEVSKLGKVYVIGATNRPDLLDQNLLRPGRFDKMVYLGITSDNESRIQILKAQTRKLNLDQDVNFEKLAEMIPENFTGADMYGLTSSSVLQGVKRKIKQIEDQFKEECQKCEKNNQLSFNAFIEKLLEKDPEADKTIVKMEDFEAALKGITPSVTMEELKKYEVLKEKFQG